ncbi:hypothetical protein INS49_011309 [Diaporthe citri]|uniref:uncharacterized protein n=1 Tax=Diaporthe citri TaxID=83186 RepID=UPI001C7E5338|nr:uncharacterized protein INS49_011309 [Diaporthe citri]KAG6360253.1 hypothetical protein INS49_011309 [Diaporthe citri]
MSISGKALEIMGQGPIENHGFVHQITVETSKGLTPGPSLDELNAKAVQILNRSMEALCAKKTTTTMNLFAWASQEIMLATTNAVYGSKNPFKDPTVQDAYYKYEAGLITLITGLMPSVLARQSLQSRDVLAEAFIKYYPEGGLDQGSSSVYARNRYEYPSKLGIPMRDIARMEAGGSIGLISNTMPATFWTLYHLLSDPVALRDCREEVSKADNGYRGNTVLIPSTVQHSSSPAWGVNVHEFYYKRFVKPKKHNPVAFRAFGGGATLFPGRHFASTEILAFASVILLRFDVKPVGSSGWGTAGYKEANASFRLPKPDVEVELIPRDNKKWVVFFSEPGRAMGISSEDITAAGGQSQVAH